MSRTTAPCSWWTGKVNPGTSSKQDPRRISSTTRSTRAPLTTSTECSDDGSGDDHHHDPTTAVVFNRSEAARPGAARVERRSAENADDGAGGRPARRDHHCVQLLPDHPVAVGQSQYAFGICEPRSDRLVGPGGSCTVARVSRNRPSTTARPTTSSVCHSWQGLFSPTSSCRASCRPCSGCGGSIS